MGLPHAVQGGRALDDPVTGRLWDRDAYRRRVGEGKPVEALATYVAAVGGKLELVAGRTPNTCGGR
jgi:hypothetical protein